MRLVVGLGNPGAKYERNRHNIGFLAVDEIARKTNASPWTRKFSGALAEASLGGRRFYLLKPQTFMNLSGESVGAAARFYKIPPEEVVVLYDELDLLPGKLRVKQGGGSGGHNGIKSIDAHLGQDYWRARIGIGHPGDKDRVTGHVLSDFGKEEWAVQEKMLAGIACAFGLMLQGDAAGFMNRVALETTPLPNPPPLRGRVREGGVGSLTAVARRLRTNMTDAERKLWYHLRRANLAGCKFRRQQPLGPYIADFACLEKKLLIELDGSQDADSASQDEARTRYLEETGHKVLRFWNNDVMENIEGVLQTIGSELQNR